MKWFQVFLLFTASNSYGLQLSEASLAWLDGNHSKIHDTLSSGSDADCAPIINSIGLVVARSDGALAFEVEHFVAEAVIWRPRLFLEWFEDRPVAFASLLKLVEESYFVADKESDVEDIEERRIRMIESLGEVPVNSSAKSLKYALEKARVRLID